MNFVVAVQALTDAGVEFAIIGGWSAIMHGSAHLRFDGTTLGRRTRQRVPRMSRIFNRELARFRKYKRFGWQRFALLGS